MFQRLQLKRTTHKVATDPEQISIQQLIGDADAPVAIRHLNSLPENARRRLYRALVPAELLRRYEIKTVSWRGPDKQPLVQLAADSDTGKVHLAAYHTIDETSPFIEIELQDNAFNGVDLNLLVLNDPMAPYYQVDYDDSGAPTHFGTVRRNVNEEIRAMKAGLAPGQVRASLGGSRLVLQHIESFLTTMAHTAYNLEPLTYASAWVFERRGFAYVRGHSLMDEIHREFNPGGKLFRALDRSTPFRQSDQWNSIRGRAWAIQDGILEALDTRWDQLRMIKQIGRHARVETTPGTNY